MHRIDHTTRKVDGNGSGKDGFEDRDTTAGLAGTVVTNDWVDDVVETIAQPIRLFGEEPILTDFGQLASTITVPLQLFETDQTDLTAIASMAEANGHFYAGGTGGTSHSKDGNIWDNVDATALNSVSFDPSAEVFVAVGASGLIITADPDSTGAIDASTITTRTAAGGYSSTFFDVIWDDTNDLFIAIGSSGEIQSSPTGTTWTSRRTAGSEILFRIKTDGTNIVVMESSGTLILTSTNGTSYTTRTLDGVGSYNLKDMIYHESVGLFVVVSDNDLSVQTSPTGVTWTELFTDASPAFMLRRMLSVSERIVFFSIDEDDPWYWTDGVPSSLSEMTANEVSLVSTNYLAAQINGVIYGNGIVMVGLGDGRLYRSQRGV